MVRQSLEPSQPVDDAIPTFIVRAFALPEAREAARRRLRALADRKAVLPEPSRTLPGNTREA